ncbi:MAG: AraC family transcriptional regulator [Hydrogenophaga sp.]|nr:AraC family transcriptional regulator [Hydrogenophaga sp.]
MGSAAHDHLSVRAYGASPGSHDHDHFQILIGLDGVLDLEVAGRGRRIAAGDGAVVPPGERHDFESKAGARCLVLDSRAPEWAAAVPSASPAAAALARYLAEACAQRLPRAQSLGASLLIEAWQPASTSPRRPQRAIDWTSLADWARARWAHGHVEVADLAGQVHLSPAQLAARCRAELGQSTQRWLRGMQLDQARALRAQGMSVADAARQSGYRSPSALTAALKRHVA